MAGLAEIRIPAELVIPIKTTPGRDIGTTEVEVRIEPDFANARFEVDGHTIATHQ